MDLSKILRFAARNALLAAALLGALAVSALSTMRVVLSSRDVAVPSLAGRGLGDAGTLAADRGLVLRIEGRRHDPSVPADHVVSQEPPPGGTLKAHRAVRVWVSLGPRRVSVPPIEGESARVIRGGAFLYAPSNARSAQRQFCGAERRHPFLGFRVVRTAAPE